MLRFVCGVFKFIYAFAAGIILTPIIIAMQFKMLFDAKDEDEAEDRAASFFRGLTIDGQQAIKQIEKLSDDEIRWCYIRVKSDLKNIVNERNEKISNSIINALVRDRLIDKINGKSDEQYELMIENYRCNGISSTFIKGRPYQ